MSAEAAQPILEQCSTLRFEWGGGGVIPEIPSAVYRSVPPSGCAPISPPSTPKPSPMTPPPKQMRSSQGLTDMQAVCASGCYLCNAGIKQGATGLDPEFSCAKAQKASVFLVFTG